jgi:hypothetical protein
MTALKSVEKGFLIDDLAAGDVDQHAPGLHRREAVFVEDRVVSGVHWQQIATKSLCGRKRPRASGPPISLKPVRAWVMNMPRL